jgi:exo beta-1,2-glucooligosaccharide sophorohydrolase (non-reducing end)
MKARALLLTLALLLPTSVFAQSSYYEHVVFDNSLADGSFYYSRAASTIPSKLETAKDKIPIDAAHFVSPPNALRLKWTSETGGDWNIEIQARVRYGMHEMSGNSLWVYSETELTANESPLIYLRDSDGEGTPSIRLLGSLDYLPAQKWVRLRLPFDSFKGRVENTREENFDPRHLAGIGIVQGLDDGKEHTLYIDDIQVRDQAPAAASKLPAPAGLAAKGYDRHVELSWH